MRKRALTPTEIAEARGMHAAGMATRAIAKAFTERGKRVSHNCVAESLKAPPAPEEPAGHRTAPVTIEAVGDLELELEAHRAARDAWLTMLKGGGLKPEELERAQKGLVRAGQAIRLVQMQLGQGTDENPETSMDRLLARLDEMAERSKSPRSVPAPPAESDEPKDQAPRSATA